MKKNDIPVLQFNDIVKLKSKPDTPFILITSQGNAKCHKILRLLPGRRLVVHATWQGKVVVMKCFLGKKALRDYQREMTGIRGFQAAGVNTPELLQCQATEGCYIVITRYFAESVPFSEVWENTPDDGKKRLIIDIIQLIAKLHLAGVQQSDAHFDNFIVANNLIYAIDGGDVTVRTQALTTDQSWDNLILFLAVFYPVYDHYISIAYATYTKCIALKEGQTLSALQKAVLKRRKWRERYVRKCLRTCTDFKTGKSFLHFYAIAKKQNSPAIQSFLKNPEKVINSGTFIKKGRTNTIVIAELNDGRKVFIKKYKSRKSLIHSVFRTLATSRAQVSWLGAHLLKFLGINTPEPIAILEKRFGPLCLVSYLITEYLPGSDLGTILQEKQPVKISQHECCNLQDKIVKEVESILLTLQGSMVQHGDLKNTNFLVYNEHVYLIDLDSIRSFKNINKFIRSNNNDINRFRQNWHDEYTSSLFAPVVDRLKNGAGVL